MKFSENAIYYLLSKLIKKARLKSIKNSLISSDSKIEAGSNIYNSKFKKHSFCGYDCDINNCEVGAFTSIGNSVIIGGGMHPLKWVGMSPVFYEGRDSINKKFSEFPRTKQKKTMVGNDVWIGQNAMIKAGVTIGDGAVIGMGSIVTKDVEPYSVVGGNPAKFIKFRFNEETVNKLLEIKWWNFSDSDLKKYAMHIQDPEKFIFEILNKNNV